MPRETSLFSNKVNMITLGGVQKNPKMTHFGVFSYLIHCQCLRRFVWKRSC